MEVAVAVDTPPFCFGSLLLLVHSLEIYLSSLAFIQFIFFQASQDVMITNVKTHFQQEYPAESQTLEERPKKKKEKEPDFLDIFLRKRSTTSSQLSDKDDFDAYIAGRPIEFDEEVKDAVFLWWRTLGPVSLRRRALDLLSIPAMSAEVERVFSSAKRLISADRNHLNPETIENLSLLKYWYRHGIVRERSVALEAIKSKTFRLREAPEGNSELSGGNSEV